MSSFDAVGRPSPVPNREPIYELHSQCVRALRDYIAEANKTCKLLNDLTTFPTTLEQRNAVLEQRQAENKAQEQYQMARNDLFTAAAWQRDPL
jgi:hypothetical protein